MKAFESAVKSSRNLYTGYCGIESEEFEIQINNLRELATKTNTNNYIFLASQLINMYIKTQYDDKLKTYHINDEVFKCCLFISTVLNRKENKANNIIDVKDKTIPELLMVGDVIAHLSGKIMINTTFDFINFICDEESINDETRDNAITLVKNCILSNYYYNTYSDIFAAACIFYSDDSIDTLMSHSKLYQYYREDIEDVLSLIDYIISNGKKGKIREKDKILNIIPFDGKKIEIDLKSLKSEIGKGTYGKVYKAKIGNSQVAIKKQVFSMSSIVEIAAMRTLKHANIQTIKSFSFIEDIVLINMQLQKQSLENLIYSSHDRKESYKYWSNIWQLDEGSKFKLIQQSIRYKYTKQMIQGLAYIHENGIIHGDIKPSNLLISQSQILKIADFGLSQLFIKGNDDYKKRSTMVYSPFYRDPNILCNSVEELSSAIYSMEADIWAAAIVIMEMETGCVPFYGEESEEKILRSIHNASLATNPIIKKIYGINMNPIKNIKLRSILSRMLIMNPISARIRADEILLSI
jgi:tRNA A-37 threonylcarbamoyl transferase component Bud32